MFGPLPADSGGPLLFGVEPTVRLFSYIPDAASWRNTLTLRLVVSQDQLSSDFCASPCPGQDASLGTCPAGGRWNATSLVNVPPAERRSLRDWRRRDGVTLVWTVHYSNYTSTPDRAASSNSPVSAVPPLPTASTAGADSGGTMDAASASRTKTWLIPVVAIAVVLFLALMALLGWRLHRSRSRRLLGSGMLYPASSDHEKRGYSAGGEVAAVGIRQLPLARIATTRSSLRSYGEEKDWIHSWRSSSIAPTRPSSQGHDLTGDEIVVVERPPDDEVQSAESGELGAGAGKRRSRNGGRPVSGRRPPSTMTTRFSDLVPSGFLLPRSRSIDSTHDVPEGANISTDAICNVGPSNVGVQVNPITVGGADGHTHSDSPPASPTFLAVRRLSRRPTSWLVRRSSRPVSHDGPHAASPLPVRQIKTSFGVGDDDRPSIDVLDPDRRLSTVVGSTTPTPRVSRPRPTSARMVHSDDGHLSHSTSEFAGVTRTLSDHDHGQRHLHGGQDYYPSPLVRSHSAGPSPFAWRDSRYSEHASAHLSREPSSVGHHTVGETGHGVSRSGSGTSSGHWLLGSAPASPARHRSGVDVRRDSVGLGLHAPADEERDVEFVDRRSDDGSDAGVEDESLSFSPSTAAANRLRLATGEQPMHPVYPAQPFFRFAPPSDSNLDASTPRLIATPAATTSEGLEEYERRLGVVPSEGAVSSGSISHTQPGGEAPRFIGQESPRGQGLGMPMWRQRLNSVGSFATLLEDRHKLSVSFLPTAPT